MLSIGSEIDLTITRSDRDLQYQNDSCKYLA